MLYCVNLETAIREHHLYPQISIRVNQLMADEKPDKNDLTRQVEFDACRKDLQLSRMALAETETENKHLQKRLQE
jgi:hypothetical protein